MNPIDYIFVVTYEVREDPYDPEASEGEDTLQTEYILFDGLENEEDLDMALASCFPHADHLQVVEVKKRYRKVFYEMIYDKFHGDDHEVVRHVLSGDCVLQIVERIENEFGVNLVQERMLNDFEHEDFFFQGEWGEDTDWGTLHNLRIRPCAPEWVYNPACYKPGYRPVEMLVVHASGSSFVADTDYVWIPVHTSIEQAALEEAGRRAIEADASIGARSSYVGSMFYSLPDWDDYKAMEPGVEED
jgi:hypothetical protein